MNTGDLTNTPSNNSSGNPSRISSNQPQVYSIYQNIINPIQGANEGIDLTTTQSDTSYLAPISTVRIDYTRPDNTGQPLITLSQKSSLNGQSIYQIPPTFNFPQFVKTLETQFGTLGYITQQFIGQNYLSVLGGTINGNLTINGFLRAYGITIDNLVGPTWSVNIGEQNAPLGFIRTNIKVFEIPYTDDGNFYFRDTSNPTNNFITINPYYKQIAITYNNIEIANSNQWGSAYTTVSNNSSTWINTTTVFQQISGNTNIDTSVRDLTANWQSTYLTVSALSASWSTGGGGGGGGVNLSVVTNYLSTNNVLLSSATILNNLTIYGNTSTTGNVYVSGFVISQIPIANVSLTSYNLSFQDKSDLLTINTTTSCYVIIPNDSTTNFDKGDQINIVRWNTGTVVISGASGVTLRSADNRRFLRSQYSAGTVVKLSANNWLLFGDII